MTFCFAWLTPIHSCAPEYVCMCIVLLVLLNVYEYFMFFFSKFFSQFLFVPWFNSWFGWYSTHYMVRIFVIKCTLFCIHAFHQWSQFVILFSFFWYINLILLYFKIVKFIELNYTVVYVKIGFAVYKFVCLNIKFVGPSIPKQRESEELTKENYWIFVIIVWKMITN